MIKKLSGQAEQREAADATPSGNAKAKRANGAEPKGRPSGPPPAPPRRKKKRSGRRR
jgi:YidC/Oxa1 family membrane protein insertase